MLGVDLRELFAEAPTISPRYVLWLVEWLPEDSALIASMRGGQQHRGWTVGTHLSASVVELLSWANYQRGEGKGAKPKPIERPKSGKPKRRTVTVAELNGSRGR